MTFWTITIITEPSKTLECYKEELWKNTATSSGSFPPCLLKSKSSPTAGWPPLSKFTEQVHVDLGATTAILSPNLKLYAKLKETQTKPEMHGYQETNTNGMGVGVGG